MKNKKIGFLGGTFDPIHLGHLNLAVELQEKNHLDEVWFVPAQVNPHKQDVESMPAQQRLEMVKLAISPYKNFYATDIELKRPPPSYTIDTVKAFMQEFPKDEFFLLLGEDAIPKLEKWHKIEELIEVVSLLIGSRSGEWIKPENQAIKQAIEKGMTTLPLFDVSATQIRNRLLIRLACDHLVPANVLDYIQKHHCYGVMERPAKG